ncbi:MAG: bifunctional pyr operon transcriptional regulator/uracil phosphoribosyltransferase PyrR [Nitrospinota bacterium]|nr:bifunctional pyr operon transcriptional regulator/uracil phosphoribosyltransferase PyrR [Nitrospinota bacterium]MDH5757281.1 bifunctional pyr operon transcriptional regulator/uracil phosphoribosyltransferase PyrR [Nitrospinota bacterium]
MAKESKAPAKAEKETDDNVILTPLKQKQVITRIAYEIVERNKNLDEFVIVGVVTRGGVLAKRIAKELKRIAKVNIPVGLLDPTLYRDDYHRRGPVLKTTGTTIPFPIENKVVLLVDDVLFTGRTINAAITHLIDLGRPKAIKLAVLIDRGHREFPIRPDYCGKNVPTQYVDKIRVRFKECDGKDMVLSGLDSQGNSKNGD